MNEPIKLLFDECLGKPLLEDIKHLLAWDSPKPTIQHLLDYFTQGTCDAVWIPSVANEGWMILTSDRAKKSSRMKLPQICQECKITHILMGPSVLHLKQSQKANAIVAVWEDIKKCNNSPKGTRFFLQINSKGRATIRKPIAKKPAMKSGDQGPPPTGTPLAKEPLTPTATCNTSSKP